MRVLRQLVGTRGITYSRENRKEFRSTHEVGKLGLLGPSRVVPGSRICGTSVLFPVSLFLLGFFLAP